ncbi:pollen receptor-like kinase 3 [Rhodamnia argentea]|uniref:Pollen receptor-like kinase 3 n=1 Tax=Rhodamnia argentea TaxID=178133 RepID=A0A8B8P917_9MYRT|nr:pollen receptor-like kinase 3 [Rhodamnia argentea]
MKVCQLHREPSKPYQHVNLFQCQIKENSPEQQPRQILLQPPRLLLVAEQRLVSNRRRTTTPLPCSAMAAVRHHFLLSSFLLVLLLLAMASLSDCVTEDEALLKLKRSITHNGALDSWVPSTPPCKGWVGVICFNGIITGLHLSDRGLSGKVDVEFLESIHGLRTISLVNNSFSGPIPEFSRLGALKSLLLVGNEFSGEIPRDFFSHMLSLKKVWLSNNNFSGVIPESLAQLPNLKELHLEGNQFSGNIPAINDEKLTSLDMSHNKLEGAIPASLVKFGASSFRDNEGLCGNPLDRICSVPQKPTAAHVVPTPPSPTEHKSMDSWVIFGTVGALLVVGMLFSYVYSNRRRDNDFSVLGKEVVHEAVEVHVSSSKHSRASSSKKGSVSKRGSQKGKDMGDLVLINEDKGPFGLSDLMKAAAEVLGNGGLGSAYKAVMSNGLSVVVKRMREMNRLGKEGFDAEMRRFGRIRHQNILTPLAYHYRKEEKLLVSEYVTKGSLLYILHGDRGICHAELNWPIRLKIIRGIARGLGFLRSEFASYDLPHGNLKSSNVLLDADYEPLLSDYAFHPLINSAQAAQAMFAYKAPESLQNQQVSPKCDVYCLGIVILEILTGKFPSQYLSNGKGGTDVVQWVHSAISKKREDEVIDPEILSSTGSKPQMLQLLHIGASCTESNPEHRINLREAIRNIEEVKG